MISKPFTATSPNRDRDPRGHAGWEAEKHVAFVLERAFGDPSRRDVRVFNDLRFPATFVSGAVAENDFAQIDHLVLHRSGMALIESKSIHGDLNVDRLGQWQRVYQRRAENFDSPVAQAKRQALALRRLCEAAKPPLLNKMLGLVQAKFGNFPIREFVAIGANGRFTGHTAKFESIVMKVDRIAEAVNCEIEHHRKHTGAVGIARGLASFDLNSGAYNLTDEELDRIERHLLASHTPRVAAPTAASVSRPPPAEHPRSTQSPPPLAEPRRTDRIEALTCGKCNSINVRVTFARDYCLKCEECGRFTSIPYVCPVCGKFARVRKDGPEYFRDCDGPGGCGAKTVFARA